MAREIGSMLLLVGVTFGLVISVFDPFNVGGSK